MDKLDEIIEDILNSNPCGFDPLKVRREKSKINTSAKIFVIGEAMAAS